MIINRICLLLFILGLLVTACNSDKSVKEKTLTQTVNKDKNAIDTTKNILTLILEIEATALQTENNSAILDTILSHCTINVANKPKYILQQIHQCLHKNYVNKVQSYSPLISESLKYKMLDCDNLGFLYLAIAEQYNLPIYGIVMPQHFIVSWQSPTDTIYWETLTGQSKSKKYYINEYGIEKNTLKPLNKRELLGVEFLNVAQFFMLKNKFEQAKLHTFKAINYHSEWANTYATLGQIMVVNKQFDMAEIAFQTALMLDENYILAKSELVNMYQKIGCLEAVKSLN